MGEADHTLSGRLGKMLVEKKWTDIRFMVGEKPNVKEIAAHSQIIAAASPVFEAMCFGRLAEGEKPIVIPDISPQAFRAMLQYIYTDRINFTSVEKACDVMYVAEKYMIENLKSECCKYLISNVSSVNAWYVLEHCCGNKKVCKKCVQMCDYSSNPKFIGVSRDSIILILEQDYLSVSSEAILLDGCVSWAEEQCKARGIEPTQMNLSAALGPAVSMIRFLSMTERELVQSASFNKLVAHADAYKIIANVITSGSVALPENISTSFKKRSNVPKKKSDPVAKRVLKGLL